MKKGSSSRKCSGCGKIIFWWVPSGKRGAFGEPVMDVKNACEWVARSGKYLCRECYEDAVRNGRIAEKVG